MRFLFRVITSLLHIQLIQEKEYFRAPVIKHEIAMIGCSASVWNNPQEMQEC
jgi:hypothetical protein